MPPIKLKLGIFFAKKLGENGFKEAEKEFPEGYRITDGTIRAGFRYLKIHQTFKEKKTVTKTKQHVKHARGTIYSHLKKRP